MPLVRIPTNQSEPYISNMNYGKRDSLAIVRLVREDTNQGVGRDIAISGQRRDTCTKTGVKVSFKYI